MDQFFAGAAPELHLGRCLNQRHAGASCTRCVDGCPVQAITIDGVVPNLDETTCVHCGVCTAICPTDSFTAGTDYGRLLCATVANLPTAPIALTCPVHPSPDITAANVSAVVLHRRCLAAITIADLLELSMGGARPLLIDDSPCSSCPIGAAHTTLARAIDAVRLLLQASERSSAILLCSEQEPTERQGAPPRRVPLIDGAQPLISRRALFQRLRPKAPQDSEPAPMEEMVRRSAPLSERLPQQTPSSRRRLLAALNLLQPVADVDFSTQRSPFNAVEVNATHCSGCGLCARFCPTGALNFTVDAAHFRLTFQPTACIACNICVVACPEDAVSLDDAVTLSAIRADVVKILVEGDLAPCHSCGMQTAKLAKDSASRCHVCRHGSGIVTAQRDDAGLMADLLKRALEKCEPDIV